jgi:hypothetical protein
MATGTATFRLLPRVRHVAEVQRSAAPQDQQRGRKHSFSGSDLLLLSKLADLAHARTEELRKAGGQANEGAA